VCQESICSEHLLRTDLFTGFHGSEPECSSHVSSLAVGSEEDEMETQRALKENTDSRVTESPIYGSYVYIREHYCP